MRNSSRMVTHMDPQMDFEGAMRKEDRQNIADEVGTQLPLIQYIQVAYLITLVSCSSNCGCYVLKTLNDADQATCYVDASLRTK